MPIGLTLPFAQTTSSLGYLAFSTRDIEAAYYNLKSLLLTNWGERPNHFYLGCNLIEYLFEPTDGEVIEKMRARIESQVSTWLPYVDLQNIDITFPPDRENYVRVKVKFGLKGRPDMNSVVDVTVQP